MLYFVALGDEPRLTHKAISADQALRASHMTFTLALGFSDERSKKACNTLKVLSWTGWL